MMIKEYEPNKVTLGGVLRRNNQSNCLDCGNWVQSFIMIIIPSVT